MRYAVTGVVSGTYNMHNGIRAAWRQAWHVARARRGLGWGAQATITRTFDGPWGTLIDAPITRVVSAREGALSRLLSESEGDPS